MCEHQLLHAAAICPACAKTAVEIATRFLRSRQIPILQVDYKGAVPVVVIDDFANRSGRSWIRYAWGTDARGRWERHAAKIGRCRLRRDLRILPILDVTTQGGAA